LEDLTLIALEPMPHSTAAAVEKALGEAALRTFEVALFCRPEGAETDSPGQRPGDLIRMKIRPALKGRNKIRNRSVPPSGANFAGKGLMIVKHVAIPGHLRMLIIHEGACCEPCGLLS
jgi:hypothetical protein